jgi:choline dehydrogenase
MNVVDGLRWNAAFAYLDPVRSRVEIFGDTLVDVLIQRERAIGVRAIVDGRPRDVRSEVVVLAAGAYGTPEILLRSGIGPPGDLRRLGIEPVVDLCGVGANLHDQPAVELRFAGSDRLRRDLERFSAERWLPEEQALAKFASPFCDGPYDLHVYPWVEPDFAARSGWQCVIPVALLTPRSRGRLRLSSADPARLGEPDHAPYLRDPSDLPALAAGARWTMSIAGTEPLAQYLGEAIDAAR